MLTTIIGATATLCSSITQPSQLLHLYKHKHNTSTLKKFSLNSVYRIIIGNSIWCVYGLSQHAIWTSVLAVVAIIVQYIIVALLIHAHVQKTTTLTTSIAIMSVTSYVATLLPTHILGPLGCFCSMVMFIPAAKAAIRAHKNHVNSPYSTTTALIMCSANVTWLIYAIALQDIWIGLPTLPNLAVSVLLLRIAQRQHTQQLADQHTQYASHVQHHTATVAT